MNNKTITNNNSKKKAKIEFEFCKVCNRNHDEGQRHKYFPNHKKSLSDFLARFQNKLSDIRFFIKNPSVLRPEHASRNRFWCVFCDSDFDEVGSSFACGNAITHLGSEEHLKNLKHFLWKHGGGMDCVDRFRVLENDIAKWKKKCELLKNEAVPDGDGCVRPEVGPSYNIHNELGSEKIKSSEINSSDPLKPNILNSVMPLPYFTNEYQISDSRLSAVASFGNSVHVATTTLSSDVYCSTGLMNSSHLMGNWNGQHYHPNDSRTCSDNLGNGRLNQVDQSKRLLQGPGPVSYACSQAFQNLTQISTTSSEKAGGNVHTGAPPPWFEATKENKLKPISSSFVSLSDKRGKSLKLNPKRVGAAWAEKRKMEIEKEKRGEMVKSDFAADWLPNFGRVWQSGSRKESRKEFEKEKQKPPKIESHSEMAITIQPYISKRMRKDSKE